MGSNLKVYWDGRLMLDVTDTAFAAGQVGLVCSQASARFDNIVVVGCNGLPNAAPVLNAIGDRTAYVGAPLEIDVTAVDPEAAPLTFSASGLPAGAAFDAVQRRLTWTPTLAQVGQRHEVRFLVRDAELDDAEIVRLAVVDTTQLCTHATFASGAGDWSVQSGTWSVEDGVYRGVSPSAAVIALSTASEIYGDFTLDARLRVEGTGSAAGGLVFRSLDATHHYAVLLLPSGDTIELRRTDGATTTKLAANAELTDDVEEWRWLRLQVQGARVRVSVDGALVYDYFDVGAAGGIWAAGAVGVQAQNASVYVDELVVTACNGTASDVGDVVVAPPPALSRLVAAPNPFNPRTTVHFTLARAGDAELVIYDATGRSVRRLFDGALPAGSHAIAWNGDDDGGRTLASGVYFMRAASGGTVSMQRLVLLK